MAEKESRKNSKNNKIFHIGSEFTLIKKPRWLDKFRLKYDEPYRYHVTFKTSTYFQEDDFENLKKELSNIAKKYRAVKVIFNKLFINRTSKGGCIMIKAERNKDLLKLQKEITKKSSKYGKHITKEYKKFEDDFKPHITIGRHLTSEQLENARKELKKDLRCEALIEELVLTTANTDLFSELNDPRNKLHYKLLNSRKR